MAEDDGGLVLVLLTTGSCWFALVLPTTEDDGGLVQQLNLRRASAPGNYKWVTAMQWSGQKNFTNAPIAFFLVDGVQEGVMQSYGPLTFLKAYNAGHLVPMDQPKAALEMLKRWTQGTLTVAGDQANIPTLDFGSLHF